jgi:hypothetical protein
LYENILYTTRYGLRKRMLSQVYNQEVIAYTLAITLSQGLRHKPAIKYICKLVIKQGSTLTFFLEIVRGSGDFDFDKQLYS